MRARIGSVAVYFLTMQAVFVLGAAVSGVDGFVPLAVVVTCLCALALLLTRRRLTIPEERFAPAMAALGVVAGGAAVLIGSF